MTIDAGVISVAITVGANHAHSFKHAVIQFLAAGIGAGIVALSILLTYRYAQRVSRWIGHTGMIVVVRLSAFIMVCIGVSITWNGVKALLAEVGIAAHCNENRSHTSFTTILPMLLPENKPMNAPSAWSSPSTVVSLCFSLPDCK